MLVHPKSIAIQVLDDKADGIVAWRYIQLLPGKHLVAEGQSVSLLFGNLHDFALLIQVQSSLQDLEPVASLCHDLARSTCPVCAGEA